MLMEDQIENQKPFRRRLRQEPEEGLAGAVKWFSQFTPSRPPAGLVRAGFRCASQRRGQGRMWQVSEGGAGNLGQARYCLGRRSHLLSSLPKNNATVPFCAWETWGSGVPIISCNTSQQEKHKSTSIWLHHTRAREIWIFNWVNVLIAVRSLLKTKNPAHYRPVPLEASLAGGS